MTSYSPSSTTAWGSVYFITYKLDFGWFVRGMHHFCAQAMVILLGLHLLQVLVAGAYRAPREFNWWFGLALMFVTLGLALTGYLLPWDQKGYWATKVATNIMGNTPVIGDSLRKVVVGGNEYGNQTLTRFYALHVAVLPGALVLLLVIHIALFRKHGVTHPANTRGRLDRFWPKQVFLDTLAVALVVGGIAGWLFYEKYQSRIAVPLDAPASPSSSDYEARPEWYFLSLFQLLKRPEFSGKNEVIGTVVVPGTVFLVLFLLPFFDKLLPRRLAHFLACGLVFVIVGGAGYFTWLAFNEDAHNSKFQSSLARAEEAARRAKELAGEEGISPEGAGYLLQRDPLTRGRAVLEQKCLSCHYYNGHGQVTWIETSIDPAKRDAATEIANLRGVPTPALKALATLYPDFTPADPAAVQRVGNDLNPEAYVVRGSNGRKEQLTVRVDADGTRLTAEVEPPQTASDLYHYGSPAWLRGLLENPSDSRYFGKVHFKKPSRMAAWKKSSKLDGQELDRIAQFFERNVINTPESLPASEWVERPAIAENNTFKKHFTGEGECFTCHADWVAANEEAPNLYGWGSPWWIERLIKRPNAPHFYGFLESQGYVDDTTNQMPAFSGGKISDEELKAVIRFLKDDYVGAEAPPDVGSRQPRPASPR
jgi:quinol-cytochrome oxidoreductase complex cytochrome b subunit/mono/diheme cytochrome c family protein